VDATTTSTRLFFLSAAERDWRVLKERIDQPKSAVQGISDECLLSLVHHNNRDALSQLFHRYASHVRAIGRRILRDGSEAEDVVQEVFLYIHTKSATFDSSKGTARSWIFQIAYTQALLRRRMLNHHGRYSQCIADSLRAAESAAKLNADCERAVEGIVRGDDLRKILKSLSEDQRETLRLHFFEGYTFAEIAEKLGQSYANVRNHHYRGLERLRKHLTEDKLNRR
jgi:RNA polymerase sigma-70 factor (ECF subfamily)